MEATGEEKLGLLSKIRPPRLEDAGLEDCALPPDSIHLAFLKAASAVGSRAASVLTEGCVCDPWIEDSPPSDGLVGIKPENSPPGPCATEKGGAWVGGGDGARDLVGGLGEEDVKGSDEVVVVGEGERDGKDGGCVDGLGGLVIKEKDDDDDDEGSENKKPTLVEGVI